LHQALSALESMGVTQYQLLGSIHLGEAYLVSDKPKDAMTLAERALTIARERGNRGCQAWGLRLLAEIASHHDHQDLVAAEAHYGSAVTLASELEMRPLVAHCHLGLGKLYCRTNKHELCRDHLITAATMYREMSMPFWLEKAEVEVRRLE
jgi:hypothetical protein